jgi:hypothetical protein
MIPGLLRSAHCGIDGALPQREVFWPGRHASAAPLLTP